MATLDIQLKNQSSSDKVFVSITGLALDKNNALFLLQKDGKTPYYPGQPDQDQAEVKEDCAIQLGKPGSTTTVTVPHLAGSRIYFSIGEPLQFSLNRGGNGAALVAPSVSNPADPNYKIKWHFCEFTWDNSQLFCNISYVDFVSLPISLDLTEQSGNQQHVTGFGANGLQDMVKSLKAQKDADNQPWDSLIYANDGNVIRIMSPNTFIEANRSLFQGYFEPYINQVWDKYKNDELSIDTQNGQWGSVRGKVGDNDVLTMSSQEGKDYTFTKPSTADIFSCSSGPFPTSNDEYGNLGARIAAGFNRSTLMASTSQPNQPSAKEYYKDPHPTNHYSRIVHECNMDKLGYAFPYDDVTPADGQDQSGKVADPAPRDFTVTIGGGVDAEENVEL
ncbi:MAG: hypothetical protein Q9168_008056 [Polycauliona sp. 1 TL-2023]